MRTLLDYLDDFNDDPDDGEHLRDEALDLFHTHRPALMRRLQRTFVMHLLRDGPATSDAVRAQVVIPTGIDPRVVGAAVRSLSSDHFLTRKLEYTSTTRKVAHARHVALWELRDRDRAEAWLRTHPDLE